MVPASWAGYPGARTVDFCRHGSLDVETVRTGESVALTLDIPHATASFQVANTPGAGSGLVATGIRTGTTAILLARHPGSYSIRVTLNCFGACSQLEGHALSIPVRVI